MRHANRGLDLLDIAGSFREHPPIVKRGTEDLRRKANKAAGIKRVRSIVKKLIVLYTWDNLCHLYRLKC